MTDHDIKAISDKLNSTPKKMLGLEDARGTIQSKNDGWIGQKPALSTEIRVAAQVSLTRNMKFQSTSSISAFAFCHALKPSAMWQTGESPISCATFVLRAERHAEAQ